MKKSDCSLFYDMRDSGDSTLKFIKEKIIQAAVSLEYYDKIKEYREADKLKKLFFDFNIQARKARDGKISYFSNEPIWSDVLSVINYKVKDGVIDFKIFSIFILRAINSTLAWLERWRTVKQ